MKGDPWTKTCVRIHQMGKIRGLLVMALALTESFLQFNDGIRETALATAELAKAIERFRLPENLIGEPSNYTYAATLEASRSLRLQMGAA